MNKSTVVCDVCHIRLPPCDYEFHKVGKKHKIQEAKLANSNKIIETGLYIRGVPLGVSAAEVGATFGHFGSIAKVEIYGGTAYINYTDRNACDEALKHQHVINNQTLTVTRRRIQSQEGVSSRLKRSADSTNSQPKTSKVTAQAIVARPAVDNEDILIALAHPSPITEQITTLKRLILAGEICCNSIVENVCGDLVNTLGGTFQICELFAFGSMTTGLAFKDSDLDVFAHLEFNQSIRVSCSTPQTVFNKAKQCFYRRQYLFSNIVPIPRAKIPIVKIVHIKTQVACDVSFQDAVGHYNSHLLRHYLNMNEQFFDMMVFIKYWARVQGFCSSSRLSNFSLCMLGISFLLSLKDSEGNKIVPPVQDLVKNTDPSKYTPEWNCSFDDTPITVTLPESPDFSLLGLLKGFFEYIAQLPFNTHVISVLTGDLISREVFLHHPGDLPQAYESYKRHISSHPDAPLCKSECYAVIHDPFKLNHNLLERVELKTMQLFVLTCKTIAEACAVAMNNIELQSSLFHRLLDDKDKSFKKTIIVDNPSAIDKKHDGLAGVKMLLSRIFEKILHFKVTELQEMEEDHTPAKVSRADDAHDIAYTQNNRPIKIICEGQKPVWNGRKKAKQKLQLNGPPSFTNEVAISDYVARIDTVAKVKFHCKIFCCSDKKLQLDFKNMLEKESGNFKCLIVFMKAQLPKWILQFANTI